MQANVALDCWPVDLSVFAQNIMVQCWYGGLQKGEHQIVLIYKRGNPILTNGVGWNLRAPVVSGSNPLISNIKRLFPKFCRKIPDFHEFPMVFPSFSWFFLVFPGFSRFFPWFFLGFYGHQRPFSPPVSPPKESPLPWPTAVRACRRAAESRREAESKSAASQDLSLGKKKGGSIKDPK